MGIFLGEVVGTMMLILLGDGVVANVLLSKNKGQNSGWIVITTAWAMAVFVGVFTSQAAGGNAHLNPAVTVGLLINGAITFSDALVYFAGEFIGAFIGDHSKTGIGTLLPTGCVIGVAANVFRSGGVPKFVPSFAWLTDAGMTEYRVDKAIQIARTVMGRRDIELTAVEERLLTETAATARAAEAAGWA